MPGLVTSSRAAAAASLRRAAPAATAAAEVRATAPGNRLLDILASGRRGLPPSLLEAVSLAPGAPLVIDGEELRDCYFIESGLVSVVNRTGPRRQAEVCVVGRDGMLGLPAVYGITRVRHDAFALTPCRARRLPVSLFRRGLAGRRAFRDQMLRYAYARMAEAMQISACHTSHALRERLARWILLADARLGNGGGEPLEITHAALAALFNVRRAGITQSLHILEGEGAIRAARRRLEIRDRGKLAALSCGCERAVQREFARVFEED